MMYVKRRCGHPLGPRPPIVEFICVLYLLMFAATAAFADDTIATNNPAGIINTNLDNLANMDIDQLLQIKVSILGPSQTVSQTPAAVSVVTQEDIQRSGAQNIPEALRLVPGMDVAQVDSSQWAVSARGFNGVFADKLLVMQDGRSLYTPLFSGVFWDVQGTLMENIDHIEVVRGPGATLWGANAVNGVINIITKSAEETQGLLVTGGGGNQDRGFGGVRYGGVINSNVFYRVYATYENHDTSVMPDGNAADNSWQLARGGFRTDWNPTDANLLTFQGDGYAGWINQVFGVYDPQNPPSYAATVPDLMTVAGANTLGRWTHTFSDTSDFKLQAYYDYTERNAAIFDEQRHSFDLNFQHEFALSDRNQMVWGLGYRLTTDTEVNSPTLTFNPDRDTQNLYSAFAQDEFTLVRDRLNLILGSKLEHNDYTGFEVEPGARLLWTPTEHQTFWTSISRAVRTPSQAEETVLVTEPEQKGPVLVPVTLSGTNTFESEKLIAYEAGYRTEPLERLSLDLAAYYNDYSDLRSQQMQPGNPTQYYVGNALHGYTYGFEASATWSVLDWWRLQPAYTLLHMHLFAQPDGASPADYTSVKQADGSSPQNQVSLRSSMDFPHGVTLDAAVRYVDNVPAFDIESYFEMDVRIGWQITKNLGVSLVGQNLLHDQHAEYGPSYINTQDGKISEIPRSVFAKVTWQF